MRAADIGEVAQLHCTVMPDGFLARIGPGVLSEIYAGALTARQGVGLVTRNGREIIGFVLATTDTQRLFRHILWWRALPLGIRLLQIVGRNPPVLWRAVESLRYPATVGPDAGRAELLAIGVRPAHRGNGCAASMIRCLNDRFAHLGVTHYTVAAYASNRDVGMFYQRLGFEVLHDFRMYGQPWLRYQLRLDGNLPDDGA